MVAGMYLPSASLHKRKKGFASDVDGWLRTSMSSKMADMLFDTDALIYRWIQYDRVQDLISEHRAGTSDNHKILYSFVILERVLRSYIS